MTPLRWVLWQDDYDVWQIDHPPIGQGGCVEVMPVSESEQQVRDTVHAWNKLLSDALSLIASLFEDQTMSDNPEAFTEEYQKELTVMLEKLHNRRFSLLEL